MAMDMADVKKLPDDLNLGEYMEQCLKTDTVIEYRCSPGTNGRTYIKGIMPTLFNGVCAILKMVIASERPEKRKELLDFIHGQVLEELGEEGYL